MLGQDWINKILASGIDDPAPIGAPQRTDEDIRRWALRYIGRIVEEGFDIPFAIKTYQAGEHDYNENPDEAADDEMSYWNDAG